MNYKTPGVYIEEISLFPPSVAQVETAIPAFIGYTAQAIDENGQAITQFPWVRRIKSLLEYETHFGKARPQPMNVTVAGDAPSTVSIATVSAYRMYYALQWFFANGGGPCYVASVGTYPAGPDTVDRTALLGGLAAIAQFDEPTLLLFPDAVGIDGADPAGRRANYHDLLQAALQQCADLGDRFLVTDLYDGASVADAETDAFRTGIGNNHLKYGAVYHPWLLTTISYHYRDQDVTFSAAGPPTNTNAALNGINLADLTGRLRAMDQLAAATRAQTLATAAAAALPPNADVAVAETRKAIQAAIAAAQAIVATPNAADPDAADALAAAQALPAALAALDPLDAGYLADVVALAGDAQAEAADAVAASGIDDATMTNIQVVFTDAFLNQLRQLLAAQTVTMPPSSAVAGVYATVDRTRGVWKAPANVSVNGVIAPVLKVTNADQDGLNVHPTGKSINVLRTFAGKGTLIWGARTLAGNDNEWRYVPVRRFYNMAEESIKKATEQFVFEPNDANTWVKVRAMIENFLVLQWRAGALAGAKPEDAFFVRVGLGTTMTPLDILEGRMNVEIGMAVVRPAEFIILKFSHKMQES